MNVKKHINKLRQLNVIVVNELRTLLLFVLLAIVKQQSSHSPAKLINPSFKISSLL